MDFHRRPSFFPLLCLTLLSAREAFAQPPGGPNAVTQPIHIRLRLDGLFPKNISITEGPAEIVLTNSTFLQPFDFVLTDKSKGQAIGQTKAASGKFRNRYSLKVLLTPGQYTIQVVAHPEWSLILTVNPKGR